MEKGFIEVDPSLQLNNFCIHQKISTISDLKQVRSQREEIPISAIKIDGGDTGETG